MIIFWVLMHSNIASECNSTHQLFQRIILYWIHACSTQCVLHMPPFSFWWNTIFSSWHQTPDYSCTLTNVVLPMLANGGLCGFSLNSYVTSVLLTHICHCGNVYIYPVIIFNNRYRRRISTEAPLSIHNCALWRNSGALNFLQVCFLVSSNVHFDWNVLYRLYCSLHILHRSIFVQRAVCTDDDWVATKGSVLIMLPPPVNSSPLFAPPPHNPPCHRDNVARCSCQKNTNNELHGRPCLNIFQ